MTSAAELQRDHDVTDVPSIVRGSVKLRDCSSPWSCSCSRSLNRYLDGPLEILLLAVILLAGLAAVTLLPGLWTRALTIEGIAGAAGIGLGAAFLFLLIDVVLLQNIGTYTNRWWQIGGGATGGITRSGGWSAPSCPGWAPGSSPIRRRAPVARPLSPRSVPRSLFAVAAAVLANLIGFPGARWNLPTFGDRLPARRRPRHGLLGAGGQAHLTPMRWVRLVFRIFGWLLTPFMAWAASFFGAVAGALIAMRMDDPFRGLAVTAVCGAVTGFVGLVLWLEYIRRSPEVREVLAVTEDGTPDTTEVPILDAIRTPSQDG